MKHISFILNKVSWGKIRMEGTEIVQIDLKSHLDTRWDRVQNIKKRYNINEEQAD